MPFNLLSVRNLFKLAEIHHNRNHNFNMRFNVLFLQLVGRFKNSADLHCVNFRVGDCDTATAVSKHGVYFRSERNSLG